MLVLITDFIRNEGVKTDQLNVQNRDSRSTRYIFVENKNIEIHVLVISFWYSFSSLSVFLRQERGNFINFKKGYFINVL